MAKRSQAWKAAERQAAEVVGGKRKSRGDNFAVSDVDVDIPDMPFLKVDAKYRKGHAHHSLLDEIREKYCKGPRDVPVLVTKHHRQKGVNVTIEGSFFKELMALYREVNADADLHPDIHEVRIVTGSNGVRPPPTPDTMPFPGLPCCSTCSRELDCSCGRCHANEGWRSHRCSTAELRSDACEDLCYACGRIDGTPERQGGCACG